MKTVNMKRLFEDTISVTRDCTDDDEAISIGEVVLLKSGTVEKTAQLDSYVNGWVANFIVI